MAKKEEIKITALYERLSRDDEQVGESNSIPAHGQPNARLNTMHWLSLPGLTRKLPGSWLKSGNTRAKQPQNPVRK